MTLESKFERTWQKANKREESGTSLMTVWHVTASAVDSKAYVRKPQPCPLYREGWSTNGVGILYTISPMPEIQSPSSDKVYIVKQCKLREKKEEEEE